MNVCFLNQNFSRTSLLVLIVPAEQISLDYLKIIATNLNSTLKFTFGNLFSSIHKTAVKDKLHSSPELKEQLDTFFAQIKSRFLYQTSKKQQINDTNYNKKLLLRRANFFNEIKSKFINAVPYFDLPYQLKCDLDVALADIEAQEFVDLENNHFKTRRQFSVTGGCLFYRNYLIATHLTSKLTKSIFDYCEHYGLFNLVTNGPTNQLHVWKEVYVENESTMPSSRFFLVVIGLKEFLYAMVLESGGVISRQ